MEDIAGLKPEADEAKYVGRPNYRALQQVSVEEQSAAPTINRSLLL